MKIKQTTGLIGFLFLAALSHAAQGEGKGSISCMGASLETSALNFLRANMPANDRATLPDDRLRADVCAAIAARSAHPWAGKVPEEIFLHDVLPYACLDETREDWRPSFRKRFAPIVADAKTLREAALILNQRIRDELKVDYNTKREKPNQSPAESIRQGMASCTGLSILLCDAFRSVGIPARIVGTSWKHKPGNHTWVEFYDPETHNWHFTEYYPDKNGPDHGWIIPDVSHAVPGDPLYAVYATSFRPTGKSFPLPWDETNKTIPAIDVTERYLAYSKNSPSTADQLELRIDFRDAAGNRTAVNAEVRSGAKTIATGTTPGPTRDANDYLTLLVPRGGTYSIIFDGQAPRAIPATDQSFQQVTGSAP